MGSANQSGDHGELAPARVSSQLLTVGGSNFTSPAPRYTNQDRWRPRFLPTVTRAGGLSAGFGGAGLAAPAPAPAGAASPPRTPTAASSCARDAMSASNCSRVRAFGMPSSVSFTTVVSVSPTFTDRVFGPSIATTGDLFDRIVGLLVPAPSAPVSDAFTT